MISIADPSLPGNMEDTDQLLKPRQMGQDWYSLMMHSCALDAVI